jgi:uncharacterized protein YggE
MKKRLLLAIGIALAIVTIGAVGCTGFYGSESDAQESGTILSQQSTGIWVTGEGKVSLVPDVAILNLGVEAQATTVTEAQQQAAEAMAAVVDQLDKHGIAEKDIKTQRFSIQPVKRWENNREILLGYRVNNMVTVKIREVEDTGVIIDDVARVGGDYTRINSISFIVDNPADYNEEAREKAMDDAEAKAKQLAVLAGVNLGKLTFINESGGYIPVPREFFLAEGAPVPAAAPTTPISPGETEVRLTVQVVYSIQ